MQKRIFRPARTCAKNLYPARLLIGLLALLSASVHGANPVDVQVGTLAPGGPVHGYATVEFSWNWANGYEQGFTRIISDAPSNATVLSVFLAGPPTTTYLTCTEVLIGYSSLIHLPNPQYESLFARYPDTTLIADARHPRLVPFGGNPVFANWTAVTRIAGQPSVYSTVRVKLNIEWQVYPPGTLQGPVALQTTLGGYNSDALDLGTFTRRFFYVSKAGELVERRWNPKLSIWENRPHEPIPGRRLASTPSDWLSANSRLFLTTTSGELVERHYDSSRRTWEWRTWGRPPGDALHYGAGAVNDTESRVFAIGDSGALWELNWSLTNPWILHGPPAANVKLYSVPSAWMDGTKFFMSGSDGHLWERYRDTQRWGWTDHGSPGPMILAKPWAPAVGGIRSGQSTMVANGMDGVMYQNVYLPGQGWVWRPIGLPGVEVRFWFQPASMPFEPFYKFFAPADDGHLYEIATTDGTHWNIADRGMPGSPIGYSTGWMNVVISDESKGFFSDDLGRIFELRYDSRLGWVWAEHVIV